MKIQHKNLQKIWKISATFLNGKDMEAIITAFQKLPNEISARIASKLYSFFINSFEKFEKKAASNEADLSKVMEPKTKKAKVMMSSVENSRKLDDSDDMSTSSDDDDDEVEKEDDDSIKNIGKEDY